MSARKRLAVRTTKDALRHVRRGHPWIFDQSITSISGAGQVGDLAVVFDDNRKFCAIGLYDPSSPIRIRVLHQGKPRQIDDEFWAEHATAALARRQSLTSGSATTGFRLINGENDGWPGLIADRYDNTIVVKLYTGAWFAHLPAVIPALVDASGAEAVVLRLARNVRSSEYRDGQMLRGSRPSAPVQFTENGLIFEADVIAGQKTGHFLDQRDNRQQVRELVANRPPAKRRVLDVFCCNGGFSVYAAAGGAASVHSIDIAGPAIEATATNMLLNASQIALSMQHETTVGDAFEILPRLRRQGATFDVVVIDPPSFAKKASDIAKGIKAYRRLTSMALPLLVDGGQLVQASCSSRITSDDFSNAVLDEAEEAEVWLDVEARTAHAVDHPVGFAEGSYLKAFFATVRRRR